MTQEEKDFFISYTKADREWAEWIAYQLEEQGYRCIIQPWDFLPGSNFMLKMHNASNLTKHTLAVLSPDSLNAPYPQQEWAAALVQDPTGEKRKLIPVRVRECRPSGILASIVSIDLVNLREDLAHEKLLQGIQGERLKPSGLPQFPGHSPSFPGPVNILIASLGDSPVVVTAMYDLLTRKKGLKIDRVIVLYPEGEKKAYAHIKNALTDDVQDLQPRELPFKDANSWQNACIFLKHLYDWLNIYQEKGDTIYLSLAGGRKSMASLTAWVVPFFSCINGLYHVIDEKERHFLSSDDLDTLSSSSYLQKIRLTTDQLDQLKLVDIPFEKERQDSQKLHEQLRSATTDDLIAKEYEEAVALITSQVIVGEVTIPKKIEVTEQAAKQFMELIEQNPAYAQAVYEGLMQMSITAILYNQESESKSYKYKYGKSSSVVLHYFTGLKVPIRSVFCTLPKDIYTNPDDEVKSVVICFLESKSADGYRSLKEIAQAHAFSIGERVGFNVLPPIPSPAESVLIVPLGKSPMVATQLYTLLAKQEQRTIHEVVLIYPQRAVEIDNGAQLIKEALHREHNVSCRLVGIPNLEDITDTDACKEYQAHLESEIERVQQEYPDCKIDLALSGGRKGMTAMTIFAAQKKHIPYVYHTLIIDEYLNEKIERETTVEALQDTHLNLQDCYDRLFLRAYRAEGPYPYADFTLFRVPVFSADGW